MSASSVGVNPLSFAANRVCHTILCTLKGTHEVRAAGDGLQCRLHGTAGDVHLLPADGERHQVRMALSNDFDGAFLLLPRGHVSVPLVAGRRPAAPIHLDDEPHLRSSLVPLVGGARTPDGSPDRSLDDVARRLVMGLAQWNGAGAPDWHDDASAFDRHVIGELVDVIDGDVRMPPSVESLAARTGLSPSHFARKFRQSTGLSLHRFVNRRRVAAAVPMLKSGTRPLVDVAAALGFASQSHFTRVFAAATGITPARFRAIFQHVAC